MSLVKLTKKDKQSLLIKLRAGHDVESAGSILKLSQDQIEQAMGEYGSEIEAAYKTGTTRIRAKILQHALHEVNPAILLKLLEQREKQSEQADPITLVERVIVQMQSCPHCDNLLGNPILNAGEKEPSTETDNNLPPVDTTVERAGFNF